MDHPSPYLLGPQVKRFTAGSCLISLSDNKVNLFYYDQLFKNKFGANSTAKLDAVENFAQGFYLLPSLTTQIHFIRTPHEELQISFTDGANTTTLQVYIFQLSNF